MSSGCDNKVSLEAITFKQGCWSGLLPSSCTSTLQVDWDPISQARIRAIGLFVFRRGIVRGIVRHTNHVKARPGLTGSLWGEVHCFIYLIEAMPPQRKAAELQIEQKVQSVDDTIALIVLLCYIVPTNDRVFWINVNFCCAIKILSIGY